jgi:hypothetical protein
MRSGEITGQFKEQSNMMKYEVLARMKKDDIGNTAKTDKLILKLGEAGLKKNVKNALRRGTYTSCKMRICARALHEVRTIVDNNNADWEEVIKPKYFHASVKAAMKISGATEETLDHPSNALKIGYHLKEMADLKETSALVEGDAEKTKEAANFKILLEKNWCSEVSAMAVNTQSERRFNKKINLPLPNDLQALTDHIIKESELCKKSSLTREVYRRTVQLCQARLLLYNKRRPGELEALE